MYTLFRILLIANALLAACAGCNQARTYPDEYRSQLVDGDKRVLGFDVDDCAMGDCAGGVRFAATDGQHFIRLEKQPFCNATGWTARVADPAAGHAEWRHDATASAACDAQLQPIVLTGLVAGASRLEILGSDGAIVDALSFSVAAPASLLVTTYHGGPGAELKLTPVVGPPEHRRADQAFVRVLDAAGAQLALNAQSVRWSIANSGVANFGDDRTELSGDQAVIFAAAESGSTSVTVEAAGLSRAVAATIAR